MTLPIVARMDELEARLNESVPTTLHTIDDDIEGCIKLGRLVPKVDCHLDGAVTRGKIVLGGAGEVLTLTMPVAIKVTARGRGDIAKHFKETADGALTVRGSARADIASDWAPSVKVVTDYKWDERIGVEIFGVRVTFASKVDSAIQRALQSIEKDIPRHLRELSLKKRAEDGWRRAHAVVAVGTQPDVWMRFVPVGVAFGGYQVDKGVLRATVKLTGSAETFVGQKPAPPTATPLPLLTRGVSGSGLDFDLPVFLDYAALEVVAERELRVGTKRLVQVPGTGAMTIQVRDVSLFQTTGRSLAVGISLDVEGFDTGTVWFTTKLSVDNQNKKIDVAELTVHSRTNSIPMDLFLSVVQLDAVTAAIRAAVAYDFSREYATALQQANASLKHRALAEGVFLDATITKVTATTIAAGPNAIQAALLVQGTGELSLAR